MRSNPSLPTAMRPQYCCLYLHQTLRMGQVRAREGNQVEITLADGSTNRQRARNILYHWEGDPEGNGEQGPLEQLCRHEAALRERPPTLDALHSAVTPGKAVPFEALARLALPADAGGWAHGLLFMALLNDGNRFRYRNGAFVPRDVAEVAERAALQARREADKAWVSNARRWREMLEDGRWRAAGDEDAPAFLAQLLSLLALEKRSPYWALLARPLGLHNLHALDVSTRLKGWLETADAWPDWPAIWLQWGQVRTGFESSLTGPAAELTGARLRTAGRRDYREIAAYTFDSEYTRDFDDACSILSVEREGLTVAVHIAEPDPILQPGHPLFEEAARRMSSVYTVSGIFPMFPATLSTGRFSLLRGAERETLTFRFWIGDDGARLLGVEPALVRVSENLSYERAQRLLDEQPDCWGRLALLCAALAEDRAQRGAVIPRRRGVHLDVSDPEHIGLREVVRASPVHQLVEELAIVHNREAGRYCCAHGLPGIYRVQPARRADGEDWYEAPRAQAAARYSTRPDQHAGLACDRYIQTTSPIRRFPDLVMQRQIATHAAGGPAASYPPALLEEWAERADSRMAANEEVTMRIEDDWKRRYLLQNPGLILEGTARRARGSNQGRVWLEPLRLFAQCIFPAAMRDGERVRVRVQSVDRDHRSVWVACVE